MDYMDNNDCTNKQFFTVLVFVSYSHCIWCFFIIFAFCVFSYFIVYELLSEIISFRVWTILGYRVLANTVWKTH